MSRQNYQNFNDEENTGEIAVGVPVNLSNGQVPAPYFPQNQQYVPQPGLNIQNPQGYYPNQPMPQYMMPNPQIVPPPIQAQ